MCLPVHPESGAFQIGPLQSGNEPDWKSLPDCVFFEISSIWVIQVQIGDFHAKKSSVVELL
jgi:hypothetical protein